MAVYCYKSDCGKRLEESFKMGDAPQKIERDGVTYLRDFQAEHAPHNASAGWPFDCWTMGVHPSQRFEAMEKAKAAGCPTEFNAKGHAVIRDKAHYKKFQKMRGVVNYDDYS